MLADKTVDALCVGNRRTGCGRGHRRAINVECVRIIRVVKDVGDMVPSGTGNELSRGEFDPGGAVVVHA